MTSLPDVAARRTRAAEAAQLTPLETIEDRSAGRAFAAIGDPWTTAWYDGPFFMSPLPPDVPAIGLVFVQTRDGNTGADDPAALGGGDTDKHFIYEGLTRAAADAVMSGATTANGPEVFFSVWRPELVALRGRLGLPRHPAQIIVTGRGRIDAAQSLIFNAPDVPVFVLGGAVACEAVAEAARGRPWVRMVSIENGLRSAVARLRREHGIRRISAIGGRTTAASLMDDGLVQDVYLTTTDVSGGEPDTPWYAGKQPPPLDLVVRKRCPDPSAPFVFEHLVHGGRV